MANTVSGQTIYTTGEASYSGKAYNAVGGAIDNAKTELEKFTGKKDLSDTEMIEYNLAASKYSTMVSLASGLIKNLADTEKQVANKM
jgi:hypothetical protein